jgi:hypothetical protein
LSVGGSVSAQELVVRQAFCRTGWLEMNFAGPTKYAKVITVIAVGCLLIASMHIFNAWRHRRNANNGLLNRIASIAAANQDDLVPCDGIVAPSALVVLALGQSSAANHGEPSTPGPLVPMVTEQGCLWASAPFPGATGKGGSIWTTLPSRLAELREHQIVLLSVLAIESSHIEEWVAPGSPLNQRLANHLNSMKQHGRPPQLILWDQGAADVRNKTSAQKYTDGLTRLADFVQLHSGPVRILLSPTTICRSPPARELHQVARSLAAQETRFGLGPILDEVLQPTDRYDGCHFNANGLAVAAREWAKAIDAELRQ